MRADRCVGERVEGEHAHDLGLAVAAGMAGPRARVDRDHLVPFRLRPERPQALQVVPVALVDLEDLLQRRSDDEGARAPLRLDEPAELLGVDAPREHVRPSGNVRRQRRHQRGDVEQRPAVQIDVVGVDVGKSPHHDSLCDERGVAEHGAVRSSREGGRVHQEELGRRVDVRTRVGVRRAAEERLVAAVAVGVVPEPPRRGAGELAGGAHGVADLLVLPDDDLGVDVVEDERHLVGALSPVRRAEHRAELRRRRQRLDDPERVLSQPEDPISPADPGVGERVGEPVHTLVELGVGEPHVATGVGVDHGELPGPAAAVLAMAARSAKSADRGRRRRLVHRAKSRAQ